MNQLYILILLIFNLLLLILVSLRKFSHAICDPIQNKYKISKRKSKLEKNFNISIDHIKLIEDAPFQICSIILLQDERIAVQGRTKIKIYNPYDDYIGSGLLIIKAIAKYGISNFTKSILFDFTNKNDMNNKEKELLPLSACYPYNKNWVAD